LQKIPSYFPLKCVSSVKEEKAQKASYTNGFKELADAKSKNVYPLFLQKTGPVLCVDIGSGTQDVLLARPGLEVHNWPRFVLPSPARMAAQRIRELTLLKQAVWLYGENIGGGFGLAVRDHIKAGFTVCSTASAASALHDNPAVVQSMGVQIAEQCPPGAVPVPLSDYSPEFFAGLLRQAGLPLPHLVLAGCQDHGFHPNGNRMGRM